jgi:hypothetical protein
MKLAIIGSGPLAIFCAQHFDQIGAEVVLFQRSPLGGNLRFLLEHFPQMKIDVESRSRELNGVWEESLIPAIKLLEQKGLTKAGEVLRVHKRFLHKNEVIHDKSRLHDLFRVIFSVNPKEAILRQLEENPEMFKQLGEQVINSLHMPVESFEDFDIVIEARGFGKFPLPMGASESLALNENNLSGHSSLVYEKDIFTKLDLSGKTHIVLVGSSETAILALLKLKEWLYSNPQHSLSWVTSERAEKHYSNEWLSNELKAFLELSNTQFEKDKKIFETKIREWRDLEDYVKAKIPKPLEAEAKIKIFQGYDVTSVDRLLDREGLFATIESPDFREHAPINDLKTLAADAILVGCGVSDNVDFARGLAVNEPGYFKLEAANFKDGWAQIKEIETQIMSFFTRVK